MRLLLDTHTFLWANAVPQRLGAHRATVEDPSNERLVSAVVSWELAIKYAIGRLPLPQPPAVYVPDRIRRLTATPVPIELSHTYGVAELPLHHRDPFDRLLVAQARALDVPILTADRAFEPYDVQLLLIEPG